MKWIVLWITLFLAWVMVFVATPRLALLGSGSSLDNLGNGIGHVGNPTGSPVEFQADPVGRITVAAQPPASAGDSQSRTGTRRCRPAVIRLTQPWRRAKEPVYVASFGAFTPDFEVEPNEHWKQLGEHRTSSILEASTEVETSCDASTCRTCVVAITARIGFAPSEIRLHEDLRRDYCARALTLQHEQQHAAVTRRAQRMAVEEARRNLAWARDRQAGLVSRASGREAAEQQIMGKVEQDLVRALQKAEDYSDRANARLDHPEQYRRESRRQWRLCRNR